MKILLANKYFFSRGGAENSFFQTAALLERKGHKICFFSMQHPQNSSSKHNEYFISNVDYNNKGIAKSLHGAGRLLYSLQARRKIEKLIERENPAIAHLNNIYHQISPSIIHTLKKHSIPIVMSLRDYKLVCASYAMLSKNKVCKLCNNGSYYHCFMRACVKDSRAKSLLNTIEMYLHHKILRIYELVDVFISPSLFLKNKVEEMGFKGKIAHLPNFVNPDEFQPQYEWSEESIVYFGRLSDEKGIGTLIRAMDGLDIKLKIIGEGPIGDHLRTQCTSHKTKNIEFLGHKSGEELKTEIKKSMFVVLPSEWYENNPRSIIEGFALGKPAVASRIGGIPELVKDNETGFTFEPGNAEDLRSKIQDMLNNTDKIIHMGRRARQFVEEELNAEKHYKRLMEIYQEAIERESR